MSTLMRLLLYSFLHFNAYVQRAHNITFCIQSVQIDKSLYSHILNASSAFMLCLSHMTAFLCTLKNVQSEQSKRSIIKNALKRGNTRWETENHVTLKRLTFNCHFGNKKSKPKCVESLYLLGCTLQMYIYLSYVPIGIFY